MRGWRVPVWIALLVALWAGRTSCPEAAAPSEPPLTVEQLLDHMESARKKLKTFRAEVLKERQVGVLDLTETFKGNIQFKMPRLLRLQLRDQESGKEIIYIVGPEYGWVVRPDRNQAERAKLRDLDERRESANPLEYGLARDIHSLREAYDLKVRPVEKVQGRDAVPLVLEPKGGTDYATGRLIFWIDPETWLPVRVREYKSNDEIIETHTFSHVQVNVPIPDEVFRFTPPRDMDVVLHDAQQ